MGAPGSFAFLERLQEKIRSPRKEMESKKQAVDLGQNFLNDELIPDQQYKDRISQLIYDISLYLNRFRLNFNPDQYPTSVDIFYMNENDIQKKAEDIINILYSPNDVFLDYVGNIGQPYVEVIYEEIRQTLRDYLDLLITTNILFNTRKVKFEGYDNLDTRMSELYQERPRGYDRGERLRIGVRVGKNSSSGPSSSGPSSSGPYSSGLSHAAQENFVMFSQSDYQIFDLQKLFAKLLEDKLYVYMNSSNNTSTLPFYEIQIMDNVPVRHKNPKITDEDVIIEYIQKAISESNFKKLFCALCLYPGTEQDPEGFGELEKIKFWTLNPDKSKYIERFFPFGAFYYCYLTTTLYFPGYMDNFEKCVDLGSQRNYFWRKIFYDGSSSTFETFDQIYNSLNSILFQDNIKPFFDMVDMVDEKHKQEIQDEIDDIEFKIIELPQSYRPPIEPITEILVNKNKDKDLGTGF